MENGPVVTNSAKVSSYLLEGVLEDGLVSPDTMEYHFDNSRLPDIVGPPGWSAKTSSSSLLAAEDIDVDESGSAIHYVPAQPPPEAAPVNTNTADRSREPSPPPIWPKINVIVRFKPAPYGPQRRLPAYVLPKEETDLPLTPKSNSVITPLKSAPSCPTFTPPVTPAAPARASPDLRPLTFSHALSLSETASTTDFPTHILTHFTVSVGGSACTGHAETDKGRVQVVVNRHPLQAEEKSHRLALLREDLAVSSSSDDSDLDDDMVEVDEVVYEGNTTHVQSSDPSVSRSSDLLVSRSPSRELGSAGLSKPSVTTRRKRSPSTSSSSKQSEHSAAGTPRPKKKSTCPTRQNIDDTTSHLQRHLACRFDEKKVSCRSSKYFSAGAGGVSHHESLCHGGAVSQKSAAKSARTTALRSKKPAEQPSDNELETSTPNRQQHLPKPRRLHVPSPSSSFESSSSSKESNALPPRQLRSRSTKKPTRPTRPTRLTRLSTHQRSTHHISQRDGSSDGSSSDRMWKCPHCPYFSQYCERDLNVHIRRHDDVSACFRCRHCTYTSNSKSVVEIHQSNWHLDAAGAGDATSAECTFSGLPAKVQTTVRELVAMRFGVSSTTTTPAENDADDSDCVTGSTFIGLAGVAEDRARPYKAHVSKEKSLDAFLSMITY